MASSRNRQRVAQNFIERYGKDELRRLLGLLSSGESGQTIADQFEVSRERVRQWKNTFGHMVTFYEVHPEVRSVIDGS